MTTPEEILEAALARAEAARKKYGVKTEMERVLDLPHQDFSDPTRTDLVEKWTARFQRPGNDSPLRRVQAEVLEECSWAAAQPDPIGMVGNVGVGAGKTLAFFLIPEVFDAQRPVLLVPPDMRTQLKRDLVHWNQRYNFRLRPANVVYYSQLSQPDGTDLLRRLNPDLIMADEVHSLRHATAARTKRWVRYMQENPDTRFVAMSGTLTGSTLSDYAHIVGWALRENSPLPIDEKNVDIWGSVLNAKGEPDDKAWQALRPLDPPAADRENRTRMRQSFRARCASSAGFVRTTTPSCSAPLILKAEWPDLGVECREAINTLAQEYVLPNGEEIVDALHYHRALNQLSQGFYYVWDWPDDEVDAEWMEARRLWWSLCRGYLSRYAREGVDSPFLVETYVESERRPRELYAALQAWKVQKEKEPPPTKAIWMDVSPVAFAADWITSRERGFVWYGSNAVGDMLEAWGIPRFGAGGDMPDPDRHPRAALSIPVHHKGKNYQAWTDQLIMEVSSSAITWQQLLGRTHRQGQTASEVRASVYQHTWPLRNAFKTACVNAEYVKDTQGEPQRILFAEKEGFVD